MKKVPIGWSKYTTKYYWVCDLISWSVVMEKKVIVEPVCKLFSDFWPIFWLTVVHNPGYGGQPRFVRTKIRKAPSVKKKHQALEQVWCWSRIGIDSCLARCWILIQHLKNEISFKTRIVKQPWMNPTLLFIKPINTNQSVSRITNIRIWTYIDVTSFSSISY